MTCARRPAPQINSAGQGGRGGGKSLTLPPIFLHRDEQKNCRECGRDANGTSPSRLRITSLHRADATLAKGSAFTSTTPAALATALVEAMAAAARRTPASQSSPTPPTSRMRRPKNPAPVGLKSNRRKTCDYRKCTLNVRVAAPVPWPGTAQAWQRHGLNRSDETQAGSFEGCTHADHIDLHDRRDFAHRAAVPGPRLSSPKRVSESRAIAGAESEH